MELTEKAAYIKGLLAGLELDPKDKQTKVINALVDLVKEMTEELADLEQCYDDVCDQIDAIDEDLSGVEDAIYDGDDEGSCKSGNSLSDDAPDSDMCYEVTCPTCGTTINLSADSLNAGGIECPNCGETLEFDFDEDELDSIDEDKTPTED